MPNVIEQDAIPAEIRQTAAENTGAPLGSKRFAIVTGIRQSGATGTWPTEGR